MYPISDHCTGNRFFNPGSEQAKGLLDVLRWKLTSHPGRRRAPPQARSAVVSPREVSESECLVTFVNHSTVLIQFAGHNILTDPIWSNRASPVSWLGPRRLAPPGIRFEDLPRIDTVLLSHNHYDHLDLPTLRRILAEHHARFVVPLGVCRLLTSNGIQSATEMDWWETSGAITCLPAKHFSARGLTDRNRTLWCSYWIATPLGSIYFGADTAFGPHFTAIRNRLGSPRLALLPIGAYKPEWFMSPVHMSPDQAAEAHYILNPERSLAIHWGTFQLGDDGPDEPVVELQRALKRRSGLPPFEAVRNGTVLHLN